jgi:hydrogenase/urease accessory protein HupE
MRNNWQRASGVPVLVALVLLTPRAVYAHAVGMSRGEYQLRGASLTVELVFARPELATALPALDVDRDGSISERELRADWRVLDEAIVGRLEVRAAAGPCAGALKDAALTEEDGLSIRAVYRCGDVPSELSVTADFLDVLSHGHRHLGAITSGATTVHLVAYSGNAEFRVAPTGGNAGSLDASLSGVVVPLFRLGVSHILTGYDHLVFLLGLILIGGRLRSIFFAVTAFTVAHSITLALSVLNIWSPSAGFVEPAIALSIAYVGVENWFVVNADRRWLITLPFGLVHGFGFAGALQQISLPPAQMPVALAAFNGGVEAGQIVVLLFVLPTILLARRQHWFADRGVRAASAAIAFAGVWWFISRVS